MSFGDTFGTWKTSVLVGIAYRITPRHECHRWVATADNREWTIRDGEATAKDGTRDKDGVCLIVQSMPEADLREFVVEQLEHYGITVTDVNWMKS